jgi:ABC-type multidrug transport system permease subunit
VSSRFAALRAVALTLGKEFRLLWRDRVGLFMLLAAPIVVIAAAGFSLADVYAGGSRNQPDQIIAVVDEDHGELGRAVVAALKSRRGLRIVATAGRERARELVLERRSALLGVIIPAGSTTALAQGGQAQLLLILDPVRYQLAVRVEVGLAEMCRRITAKAAAQAEARLLAQRTELTSRINGVVTALRAANEQAQELSRAAARARAGTEMRLRAQIVTTIADASTQMRNAFAASLDQALAGVTAKINLEASRQRDAQRRLRLYFAQLDAARSEFERWFAQLKELAGGNATRIPAPPQFPLPPPDLVALLHAPPPTPVDAAALRDELAAKLQAPDARTLVLPPLPPLAHLPHLPPLPRLSLADLNGTPVLPGSLGLAERPANLSNATARGFNAFDLQVPGFAVTFLLIGMLMGLSLALIDEHDWGTLTRLRAASAPLGATLFGKMIARFLIGLVQMIILFAAGWALFGMSLGRAPSALLVPGATIAFAAAAFGLVVAGAGRTRDAVLPIGAIVIMTMAAMGGCWWPIDFEPQWMRTLALALPTTWAMRAFNDLMIRDLPLAAVLVPSAVNLGFGILYAAVGVAIARRRFT